MRNTHPQPLRVLHVDDDPEVLALVGDFLSLLDPDIQVVSILSPADSIAYLEREPHAVQCVISDYNMPDIDGVELLRRVREIRPTIPFILYTNHRSEQTVVDACEHDVTACVQKGGNKEHFESLARQIKNLSRHRRESRESQREEHD